MAFKAHKAEKAYYLWSMGGYGISFVLAPHICERGRRMMLVVTSASSWADVEIELIL